MIDIQQKKRKILEFLEKNGPSLPVRIAKAIEMEPVFASAILSELLGPGTIIISHMKIGASPLYLLPTQKQKLEEKTDNLKSIEKETYESLKSRKIIIDEKEEPAIRVALRNLKDFAIPFKFKDKIIWKYAFTPQEEIDKLLLSKEESKPEKQNEEKQTNEVIEKTSAKEEQEVPKAWEIKKEEIIQAKKDSKKIESIFEKPKEKTKETKPNETFLEEIETFLKKQDTKITSIEEVDKKKVIAKIETNSEQVMLFAFNRKKINETELFKCYRYAKKANLQYQIITKEDPTKKMNETIDAYKSLIKIENLGN
ncbi:MAG: hypothetical protein V1888_00700 [archaeon]